jgi:hypothetical protein
MRYIPILRFRPVELKILLSTPHNGIFPLLEIVDSGMINKLEKLKERFENGIMVDLPLYLLDNENKYFGGVMQLLEGLDGSDKSSKQVNFFKDKKNKEMVDIPVVSSESIRLLSYKNLVDGFKKLKDDYKKIAFRIFVRPVEISSTEFKYLEELVKLLRENDIILLDVVEFDSVEPQVLTNLQKIVDVIQENKKTNTFILNAFDVTGDWKRNSHHYAPLLVKITNVGGGFGDFATIPRSEDAGGSYTKTSIIRFFSPWDIKLVHFMSDKSFFDAKRQLKKSKLWQTSIDEGHFSLCDSCKEIDKKDTEWKTYWKFFRINHHINCMISNMMSCFETYNNPQDFDMEGYNNIFKKT